MSGMSKILPVKSNGDVPIPPDVRERLHWNGSNVVMEEVGDAILLRREGADPRAARQPFDWDEFRRHVPRHEGEPGTPESWKAAVDRMFVERGRP